MAARAPVLVCTEALFRGLFGTRGERKRDDRLPGLFSGVANGL